MANDIVEFYVGDKLITSVKTEIVPHVSSLISIRKVTYEVIHVSFSVDYSDQTANNRVLRANIDLKISGEEA